jgi:hypothetical protein
MMSGLFQAIQNSALEITKICILGLAQEDGDSMNKSEVAKAIEETLVQFELDEDKLANALANRLTDEDAWLYPKELEMVILALTDSARNRINLDAGPEGFKEDIRKRVLPAVLNLAALLAVYVADDQ